jgi:hypothetical protein
MSYSAALGYLFTANTALAIVGMKVANSLDIIAFSAKAFSTCGEKFTGKLKVSVIVPVLFPDFITNDVLEAFDLLLLLWAEGVLCTEPPAGNSCTSCTDGPADMCSLS